MFGLCPPFLFVDFSYGDWVLSVLVLVPRDQDDVPPPEAPRITEKRRKGWEVGFKEE